MAIPSIPNTSTPAQTVAQPRNEPARKQAASHKVRPEADAGKELGSSLGLSSAIPHPADVAPPPSDFVQDPSLVHAFEAAAESFRAFRPSVKASDALDVNIGGLLSAPATVTQVFDREAVNDMFGALGMRRGDGVRADGRKIAHAEGMFALFQASLLDARLLESMRMSLPPRRQAGCAQVGRVVALLGAKYLRAPVPGRSAESPAFAADDIILPSPELVAVEGVLQAHPDAFAGMPIEELVQIVMMECSKQSEKDLRAVLDELKETNKKKQQLREHVAAQKKQAAQMNRELQLAYDRRVALEKGHPERIVPELTSFEAFKRTQMIVQVAGGLDADGSPIPGHHELSKDKLYYPQEEETVLDADRMPIAQEEVDRAKKLHITPQNFVALRKLWDADPALQTKFHADMLRWMLTTGDGGVGLTYPPQVAQDAIVATYRQAVGNLDERLMEKYAISKESVDRLQSMWLQMPGGVKAQFGFKVEAWLTGVAPLGVGLQENGVMLMDDRVDAYLGTILDTLTSLQAMATYGATDGELAALREYYSQSEAKAPTFDDFLRSAPPAGPGFGTLPAPAGTSYSDKVRAFFAAIVDDKKRVEAGNSDLGARQAAWDAARAAADSYVKPRYEPWDNGALDAFRTAENGKNAELNTLKEEVFRRLDPGTRDNLQNHLDWYFQAVARLSWGRKWACDELGVYEQDYTYRKNELINRLIELPQPHKTDVAHWMKAAFKASIGTCLAAQRNLASTKHADTTPLLDVLWQPKDDDRNHINMAGSLAQADRWLNVDEFVKAAGILDDDYGTFRQLEEQARQEETSARPQPPSGERPTAMALAYSDGENAVAANFKHGKYPNRLVGVTIGAGAPQPKPLGPPSPKLQAAIDAIAEPVDHTPPVAQRSERRTQLGIEELEADVEAWEKKLDTLGDMTQSQSMQLQMYLERKTKFAEALSNLMKAYADTANNMIANMKA